MKQVYLTLSGVFLIIGLIICFENIMMPSSGLMIGFTSMLGSMFFPLLILMGIGFGGGLFAGLALMSGGKGQSDEGDDGDLDF